MFQHHCRPYSVNQSNQMVVFTGYCGTDAGLQ